MVFGLTPNLTPNLTPKIRRKAFALKWQFLTFAINGVELLLLPLRRGSCSPGIRQFLCIVHRIFSLG